jgi:hypothetical protein
MSDAYSTTKGKIVNIDPLNEDDHHSILNLITETAIGLTSSEWKVESALKMERQSCYTLHTGTSRTKRLF